MQKKILAIAMVVILLTSGFYVLFTQLNLDEDSEPAEYTKPSFETSGEVNDLGLLIDVDYDEIESNLKKYDEENYDNDSLDDDYEEMIGLDPYLQDSDGDGIPDDEELNYATNPLKYDTDGDDLSDYQEVFNYSTDPTSPDTDGDGLIDSSEIWFGTNPNKMDCDEDEVKDGDEINWNEDTDLDGKINALDTDSDGDGLNDRKEIAWYYTDMINPDTDGDGLNDYYETEVYLYTDPLIADTDEDGLIDSKEAYDSIWLEAEKCLATGASSTSLDEETVAYPNDVSGEIIDKTIELKKGNYKIMAFAKIVQISSVSTQDPKLSILYGCNGEAITTETIYLPSLKDGVNLVNELRWVSTDPFEITESCSFDININIENYNSGDIIAIDKISIIKLDILNKSFSNPLDADSDNDGLIDGKEASEDALWFEAEDFVFNNDYILEDPNASSGKVISTTHLALGTPTTIITIDTNSNLTKGFYSLFIRGYSTHWSIIDAEVTYTNENGDLEKISGTYEIDGAYPRGLWTAVYFNGDQENLKMELPRSTQVIIEISTNENSKTDPLSIDELAFVKMTYKKPNSEMMTQLPGLVPRLLCNPIDPDTDGDQYREQIGAANGEDCDTCASMLSLYGYLTDSFELDNGMNPMSLDSDSDSIADDIDPNPLGQDADDDGIPDFFEDTYPENNPDGIYQPDNETTDWCNPDTDRDRVIDGNEDWDYDTIVDIDETNSNHPDTDGDGLLDGGSSISTVLMDGLGHSYRTSINSAQYNYITEKLSPINESGTFYDPWITNGDGTVTFIGEVDKNTDPTDVDSDDDLIPDGIEVFVYGTNPAKIDTDGDSYSDHEEIYEMGTDPLVADYPDLIIKSITMNPDTPEVDWWNSTVQGIFVVEVENIGVVDAEGTAEIHLESNGISIYEEVENIGTGQVRSLEVYYEAVIDDYYDSYYSTYSYEMIYKPGKYDLTASIQTKNPEKSWCDKITEADYSNNDFLYNVTIKGAPPIAYINTNYNLNLITTGENITFYYNGYDADGEIVKYELDVEGDGIWDYADTVPGILNHTFLETSYNGTESADFIAVLRVTDDDGKTAIDYSKEITVMPSLSDDTDGDGLTNEEEIYTYGTNTMDADYDQDTLNDYQELLVYNTDPFKADSDGDGITDNREIYVAGFFGINATDDVDGDGLPNILDADSDNDGIKDGTEYKFKRPDVLDPISIQIQSRYNWHGLNPFRVDTDFDGISDPAEEGVYIRGALSRPYLHLSSKKADTDNDGMNDFEEVYVYATDANNQDTDNDGLPDGADLQPASEVVTMNTVEDEFGVRYHCRAVEGEKGLRWTKYYPEHSLRFESYVRLYGVDGNSWEIWGEDDNLGNEGVMDSNIGSSALDEIGYGKYSIYDHEALEDSEYEVGRYTTTYDGWRHYKIKYELEARNYKIYLWNNQDTTHPNYYDYTVWETGLEPGCNNSIEIQFKIENSKDKYDISNDENLHIPGFSYKLFKKGTDGLEIKPVSEGSGVRYLYYNKDPVYLSTCQATPIDGNLHWYQAELRLPKEYVTSENMFVMIAPVWQTSKGEFALWASNLKFASLSKLVYYEEANEKLRIGCREFSDLSNPIQKPSSWDGQIYNNYTSVRKINQTSFLVTDVTSVKKAEKITDRWEVRDAHITLEKIISSTSTYYDSVDDFTGELASNDYKEIREKLRSASNYSVLATDFDMAILKLPEDNLLGNTIKWATTSVTGEMISEVIAPELFKGVSKIGFKATAVTAVVFGAVDIGIGAYKYANEDNPILKRQYAEQMWAAGVSIALNLVPYYIFIDIGVKLVVYTFELLVGWPDNVNLATLSDPAALIVFAVEYLIPGTIPSDIAKSALEYTCNLYYDYVELKQLTRTEGESMYIFIPPS